MAKEIDYMNLAMYRKILKWIDENKLVKFYQTKTWLKVRKIVINMNGGKCAQCGNKAHMVHHLKKVKEFPSLALLLSNLEPLCNSCHNKEHPEKLSAFKKKKFKNEERW
ncbi:HNH endonuclease [Enterococcus sp. DIV1420a]|uniref:HNH endonuclease n=1 Tax=Enterococcus TaxID=1350 RepID=UPI003F22494D